MQTQVAPSSKGSEAPNIPNGWQTDKSRTAGRSGKKSGNPHNLVTVGDGLGVGTALTARLASGVRVALAAALALSASLAAALPVEIGWQIPLTQGGPYLLEIAKDAGFGEIVHSASVTGKGYPWDAPAEGVYHWRLARPGQASRGGEVTTFVSGSFAVIDPASLRERPARLSWEPVEGANNYKLYVFDGTPGVTRTMTTQSPAYTVPKTDVALMIEVVAMVGYQRVFRDYHFNPTLTLDTGVPPPPPPPPPAPAEPEVVELPATPVVTPEAAEKPAEEPPAPEPARRRRHLVSVFGVFGAEEIRVQQLQIDVDSVTETSGAGARLWTNPWEGLVAAARGTYHEHEDNLDVPTLALEDYEMRESRFTGDVYVGWDLLNGFRTDAWMLGVGLAGVMTQVPMLDPRAETAPEVGVPPALEPRAITLLGGGGHLAWFPGFFAGALELDGGVAAQAEDDARVSWQRLTLEWYPTERFLIEVGGLARLTQANRCHPDHAECLGRGKVRASAVERAVTVGLGSVFR
jgi:hypothetical protein